MNTDADRQRDCLEGEAAKAHEILDHFAEPPCLTAAISVAGTGLHGVASSTRGAGIEDLAHMVIGYGDAVESTLSEISGRIGTTEDDHRESLGILHTMYLTGLVRAMVQRYVGWGLSETEAMHTAKTAVNAAVSSAREGEG